MWKNPKDIRLLDRMIARGEIIEEWGKWRFTNEVETESWQKVDIDIDSIVDKKLSLLVQEYKDRIDELEKELTRVQSQKEKLDWITDNLVKENKYLEEELKKKCSTNTTQCSTDTTPSSSNDDLVDHLALMYTYVEQKNEFMNKVVKSYYDKFQGQYDREWAVEKVYGMYWYTPDEWEKDELEYVRSLIS